MGRKRRNRQDFDGFGSPFDEEEDYGAGFGDDDDYGAADTDFGPADADELDDFTSEVDLDDEPGGAATGPGSADPDLKVVRLDKWLWAARLYKTRSIATEACSENQVKVNDAWAKASKMVRVGDEVVAITAGGKFRYKVVGLAEQRGPAAAAATLFEDETPEEWNAPKKPWEGGAGDFGGGIVQDKKGRKRDRRAARKLKRR